MKLKFVEAYQHPHQ